MSASGEATDDWLAGAAVEFGCEITEPVDVALEGLEFGADDSYVA